MERNDRQHPVSLRPTPTPAASTPKKRRLPASIVKVTRPPPETRSMAMDSSLFESSSEMDMDPTTPPLCSSSTKTATTNRAMSTSEYLAMMEKRLIGKQPWLVNVGNDYARILQPADDVMLRSKRPKGK
ncbi:hypothetical protein BG004_002303 [Podila humilis]|nr:hypothetical protein BG004_002303 [Podila humilis]